MEYLLRFYDAVDLEGAAVQSAVLDEVTYAKVVGAGAKQTYARAKGAAKWLVGKFGVQSGIDDTPAKTVAELVMERSTFWKKSPAPAVRSHVIAKLASRLQVSESDLGSLSTRLIEEAAAGYGISEDLLLSQQAEAVGRRYLEDCVKGLQEQLKKQGDDEIRATENILSKHLAEMTPAERLEIQKALNLETLSASSLRSVFMQSGLPMAGIAAIQVGGFGSYLALSTIMHAVFTSMLGITLPFAAYTTASSALSLVTGPIGVTLSLGVGLLGYFWGQRKIDRSQYAMIVWTCLGHAGGRLAPATAELPSVKAGIRPSLPLSSAFTTTPKANPLARTIESSDVPIPSVEAEDFRLLKSEGAAESSSERSLSDVRESSQNTANQIRGLQERQLRNENQIASLHEQLAQDSSLQAVLKSLLEREIASKAKLKRDLEVAQVDSERLKQRLRDAEAEHERAHARYRSRLERRGNELKALWQVHFPKCDFHQQPLRWAAEQDFHGRIEIERALKELADAPDPVKLSRSKMHATHEHHSRFTIPKSVECRLFYTVRQGRIDIRRMCKKKDV